MQSFPHWVLKVKIQGALNSLLSHNRYNALILIFQTRNGLKFIDKYNTDMSEDFRKFVRNQLYAVVMCEQHQEKVQKLTKLIEDINEYSWSNEKHKQLDIVKQKITQWNIDNNKIDYRISQLENIINTECFVEVDTVQMALDVLIEDIHKIIIANLIVVKRLREHVGIGSFESLPNNTLVDISDKITQEQE